jgi:hypothetical protein
MRRRPGNRRRPRASTGQQPRGREYGGSRLQPQTKNFSHKTNCQISLETFMPNYNAQVPPYSIFPGDVALAFNSEAPATGQASQQFALPSYAGMPDNGRTIVWQTIYGTAPSAISVVLQSAMNDVDAQYATIDTSTATAGESRTVTNVRANFVRAKVSSITGGAGVVVQILG